MISIIIPAYNQGYAIARCLNSIDKQTYQDFEVIIVNDGSTDNTLEVIKNVCKTWKREVTLIYQENLGACSARNKGFKYSKGEYVLFCDSDLILYPMFLEKLNQALNTNPQAGYAYSDFKRGFKTCLTFDFDSNKLKQFNYIAIPSLIRRNIFPGFDESIRKFQDWDLWLTLLDAGHIGVRVREILFKVIPSRSGMSTWLPSAFYKINWKKFGMSIKAVDDYHTWTKIIKTKHKLA